MRCYISSACSSISNFAEALNELTGLGFRKIALTGNIKYTKGLEGAVLRFKEERGIDFIIHNYFPFQPEDFVLNLASRDHYIKEKTLNHIKHSIGFSRKLGKDLYSLHPGFKNDLLPELKDSFFIKASNRPNNEEAFYDMIDTLLEQVIKDDFRIAVENLFPKSSSELYSFLCTPDDIEKFFYHFHDRTNVGILLDLGHLNVASKRLNFDKFKAVDKVFSRYLKRIFEIHISENDGSDDSHDVSELDSWQIKYLEGYREYLKDTPVTLEWHNSANSETFERYEMIRYKLEG